MFNTFTIIFIFSSILMIYLFFLVIQGKIKVYYQRLKMQEAGEINKDENIKRNLIYNLIFWMLPVTKYKEKRNPEHNIWLKKVNYSLIGLLSIFIFLSLINMYYNN